MGSSCLALDLALSIVNACNDGSYNAVNNGFVAVNWFWEFAHWMILATLMLNLCGALFRATSGTGKIAYFISTPILVLVAILMLAFLGLYSSQGNNYNGFMDRSTQGQLNTAELVFNLIGALVIIIFMVLALVRMSSHSIRIGVRPPRPFRAPANIASLSSSGSRSSWSSTSAPLAPASPTPS
jgi:hypothetical protein